MNTKSSSIFERSTVPEDAIRIGIEFLSNQNIEAHFTSLGNNITTVICKLMINGNVIATGIGKGIDQQCKASALFEAIEHYFWGQTDILTNPIRLDLKSQDSFLVDACPDFNYICGNNEVEFSRVKFDQINNSQNSILYPYFLTNPFWESTSEVERNSINSYSLMRYSSNSGTASGLSKDEAMLHALLESIERDAIGIELLSTIIRKKPLPVRRLIEESLPNNIRQLISRLNEDNSLLYGIWDISTSDINIPVMLVCVFDSKSKRKYFGSGSSLSVEYAVERALLEAIQSMHMWRTKKDLPPQNEITPNTPLYLRCMLDRGYFGFRGGETNLDINEVKSPSSSHNTTIIDQIDIIIKKLKESGFNAFQRSILDDKVYVCQVVIPGLELFHLVTSRIPVLPGNRGRKILGDK
jgi:ribosomal protein S12 methylthiotransferase accessory factor